MSRRLAAKAGTVAGEGLNVKGMTSPAKGTAEAPGTMVARKAGTNRVILNAGWTALKGMLDCKAANVIVVPARNTSRKRHESGAANVAGFELNKGVLPILAQTDSPLASCDQSPPDCVGVAKPGFRLKGPTSSHCHWIGTFA